MAAIKKTTNLARKNFLAVLEEEILQQGSGSNVTFVENYSIVLPILKRNIFNLGYQDNSSVIDKNILNQLNFKNFDTKFDIIFMDPPYKEKNLSK